MLTVHQTPDVTLTARASRDIEADLLILPIVENAALADEPELDTASGGEVEAARARGEITGKAFSVFVTTLRGWKASRVALVGVGSGNDVSADRLRRAATTGALAARHRRLPRIAIVHRPDTGVAAAVAAQVMAEGAVLANFDGAAYKTADPPRVWLETVQLKVGGESADLTRAAERGRVLGECTNLSRSLSNEPGNVLTPRVFAERASAIATDAGLSVEIFDEARIADLKMGLLLGVARGSREPPRLVVLRYEPPAGKGRSSGTDGAPQPVLGLIGKGVTFDTGGISIKPSDNMDKMKDDMSGGAAVVCAMAAIARLQAPVRCVAVIPMVENMPDGLAAKPGDVLTSAEGKTVEVLNTDAEGRLILGDAVWYARQLGATHLVDVATLTGACVVALGRTATGLFGTPDAWVNRVKQASERAGERSWPMPVFDDYKELFKSEIADFANTGGRAGGAITAALFIKEFTGGLPWVHLDIAGTAWAEQATPYQPTGATGTGVRTLAELALDPTPFGV
ncbi:MAG: leucyl aminopeptidase [Acidobacteria bacterium]|nr:leucyl aminopeptidase [Acidobacteriota bacterium]